MYIWPQQLSVLSFSQFQPVIAVICVLWFYDIDKLPLIGWFQIHAVKNALTSDNLVTCLNQASQYATTQDCNGLCNVLSLIASQRSWSQLTCLAGTNICHVADSDADADRNCDYNLCCRQIPIADSLLPALSEAGVFQHFKHLVFFGRHHQHNISTFSCSLLVEICYMCSQHKLKSCVSNAIKTFSSQQEAGPSYQSNRSGCLIWRSGVSLSPSVASLTNWMSMSSMRRSALVLVLSMYNAAHTECGHNGLLPQGYWQAAC